MGKKREGQRTTIGFTADDLILFNEAAAAEGASSIIQWLLATGRKRARMLTGKGPVRLTEVIIPPPEGFQVDQD